MTDDKYSACFGHEFLKEVIIIKTQKISIFYTFIFMGIIIALSESVYQLERLHEKNTVFKRLLDSGGLITQQIQNNLDNGIFATDILHVFLTTSNFNLSQFNTWGENIMRLNPNASAVQLAPDGVVQYSYPLEDHKGAIGHDLLKDQRRNDGAIRAIKNKTLTIVGPIKLIQNGRMTIIARKPIFREESGEEKFWGFTIVLIYIESLLPESLLRLENQGVVYQIVGDDPDSKIPPVFKSSKIIPDHWDYVLPIKVANGSWQLKLFSKDSIANPLKPSRILGIVLSLVLGLLFFKQQRAELKRSLKIEILNNDLTRTTHELRDEKEKLQIAFEEIKTLKGIVPICSKCKKIRDDQGYWNLLESYIEKHTDALFSHGMCPDCSEKLYGTKSWYIKMKNIQKRTNL